MKKRFMSSIILLCVLVSVAISGCDDPNAPPDGMVLIPAGEFEMGSDAADADADEQPVHTVYVDAFYMDKYEVTVGQYKAFVQATDHRAPEWDLVAKRAPTDEHPIVRVTWHDAMAYAQWVGKRLPTEAEWEHAARGGLSGQTYPWGDAAPNGTQCNLADKHTDYDWSDQAVDDGYRYAAPVGRYPANGYGLYDMAGNVWEWCLDEYHSGFYAISPFQNPLSGAPSVKWLLDNYIGVKSTRVLRGGAWYRGTKNVRVANRNLSTAATGGGARGFRCARAVSPSPPPPPPPPPPLPDGMVLIPAGEFEMGSDAADADADEQPVHTVYVDAFYMDKYEVTVGQYKAFVQATDHGAPEWNLVAIYSPTDEHPIVGVTWHDAMAYAQWAGKRLPTEAEWEKAARGGLPGQTYPWGDATPNSPQCNFADSNTDYAWSDRAVDDGYRYAAPVGRYPANRYGLYDMAGNVWEWCLDEYHSGFYAISPSQNPLSGAPSVKWLLDNYTDVESLRVLRGGSWYNTAPSARVTNRNRNTPTSPGGGGFRCVRAVTP